MWRSAMVAASVMACLLLVGGVNPGVRTMTETETERWVDYA
jgi:hypothetical protein